MTESKSFNRVATIILTFLVIITLLPIILLVIASFTNEQALIRNGYSYFPEEFRCILLYDKTGNDDHTCLWGIVSSDYRRYCAKCVDYNNTGISDVSKII